MLVGIWLTAGLLAANPWAPVYEAAGITRDEARVDTARAALYGGGLYRLPLYELMQQDPLQVPALGEMYGAGFVAESGSLAAALIRAGQLSGLGVRRGLVAPVADGFRKQLDADHPVEAALAKLRAAAGATAAYDDPPANDLPPELQQGLAMLLLASADAVAWRARAFEQVPAAGLARNLADLTRFAVVDPNEDEAGTESLAHERRLDRLVAALDLASLDVAAVDLAFVLDDARQKLAGADLSGVKTRLWSTPVGSLILGGAGRDDYSGPPPLLVLDVGGDDHYATGAVAATDDRPVSLVLDLAGDDVYDSAGPSWGAGIGGVGLLVDVAGNDQYTGGDSTQGCGVAGVGALWDGGGNDQYRGRCHAQGSASFGLGVLVDRDGDDTYTAVHRSQGYGYTLGSGVLVDVRGKDTYVAEDGSTLFPSAQAADHTSSLCQGFGFGRRADFTTGHSLSGGTGWLVDGEGDDQYSCGVFGQGGGYWYGVGMLCDLGGNDQYHGVWYVQGAAAHFAVGGLLDAAGNDRYEATHNMAQGAGHDFSLGFLCDQAGNDAYLAPNLALGAGNANGVGYFWEVAGDDTYTAKDGVNLGRGSSGPADKLKTSPRIAAATLGLFLDEGGTDTYSRTECGDGKAWHQEEPGTAGRGAGVDR
ncbi:MAG: hypothetical protein HYU66_11050 [Armatimonadetes bacterium]|nr:hypothetical protein [Armatimonadota bacterium]